MSFRITLSPSKRAAGRFIESVRRSLQKALSEEGAKRGLTQADIARTIGVDRSVIHRELRGHKDITLGRVAELAAAMGRKPQLSLPELATPNGNASRDITPSTSISTPANSNKVLVKEAYL
ncbi:helix-turn-helix domain-containing protein [Methylorubrum sp. POS3]|uniref:helix-turn-helix domain-containing protein n=1 Tax=Methylorubrum sp. POS3 TaxID=2998492 RepID=UPI00372D4E66